MSPRTIDRAAPTRERWPDDALGLGEEDDADDGTGSIDPESFDLQDPWWSDPDDLATGVACDGRDPFDVSDNATFIPYRADRDERFLDEPGFSDDE